MRNSLSTNASCDSLLLALTLTLKHHLHATGRREGYASALRSHRSVIRQCQFIAREDSGQYQLHFILSQCHTNTATTAAAKGQKLIRRELAIEKALWLKPLRLWV